MAPFVKITPTSTKFVDELRKRAASFRSARIAASICVPSDLKFWYYLEFGTASKQDGSAPFRGTGKPYPIQNVNRGDNSTLETLHWSDAAGEHFPKIVTHFGIRPHPFVRPTIPKILEFARKDLYSALVGAGGFRAGNVKEQLLKNTMPRAIEMIGEALAAAAPGTRQDGKLDGNTAASVWLDEEQGAYVVDAANSSPGAASSVPPPQQKVKAERAAKTLTWDKEAVRRIRETRLYGTKTLKRRTKETK